MWYQKLPLAWHLQVANSDSWIVVSCIFLFLSNFQKPLLLSKFVTLELQFSMSQLLPTYRSAHSLCCIIYWLEKHADKSWACLLFCWLCIFFSSVEKCKQLSFSFIWKDVQSLRNRYYNKLISDIHGFDSCQQESVFPLSCVCVCLCVVSFSCFFYYFYLYFFPKLCFPPFILNLSREIKILTHFINQIPDWKWSTRTSNPFESYISHIKMKHPLLKRVHSAVIGISLHIDNSSTHVSLNQVYSHAIIPLLTLPFLPCPYLDFFPTLQKAVAPSIHPCRFLIVMLKEFLWTWGSTIWCI